jgi:hypothetical protein
MTHKTGGRAISWNILYVKYISDSEQFHCHKPLESHNSNVRETKTNFWSGHCHIEIFLHKELLSDWFFMTYEIWNTSFFQIM